MPTEVQARAWPEIAAGRHVLATAPTGSGKTLTAFLWALDRLLSGEWEGGRIRVLYVSPLKALNADVERNLERPLAELLRRFEDAGVPSPGARAATRSGDTPTAERQKLLRHPPEILITTPESLNLMLTSQGGRSLFAGLRTVILDEIHAVAGSKRGTHLLTAVERLTLQAGEIQRVALSATVRPLERVAEMVGGFELLRGEGEAVYRKRAVSIVRSAAPKAYEIRVRYPLAPSPALGASGMPAPAEDLSGWDQLVPEVRRTLARNRSTLVFTNSRRTTERLTRLLNEGERGEIVYSHHGSLSKEVRAVVESRLKRGELPALVATSSLELGIDIGDLDEVLLVQTPRSVASALQRIGRAGHRVGEVSRGTFLPFFPRDLLDACVVARAVAEGDIEDVRPPHAPLDVLAQVLLSMVVSETWQLDELYAFVRCAGPYADLSRRAFDLVVEMLAGRYADSRVRELKPRVSIDRVDGTIRARPGAAQLLYLSGGTIPDRGYYHLRVKETGARLGELDEEFVWERSIGDTFTLGAQGWRITQITHNDVFVVPARGAAAMPPFWRADEGDRDFHLLERVGTLLESLETRRGERDLAAWLEREHRLERPAAEELLRQLELQRAATGSSLPHRHLVLCERVREPGGDPSRHHVLLHTLWGGRVNRPLALALAAAWEERYPASPIEVVHDDGCISLVLPEAVPVEELFASVPPESIEALLRRRLETSGFFGALFRHNAQRALLLPRAAFAQRMPLWLSRQRAKKLLEVVSKYGDFPIVVETWRACLEDEMEIEVLKRLLSEVAGGAIRVQEVVTATPSPFAANLRWKLTNTAMYDDDTPLGGGGGVRPDVLREVVLSAGLRPRVAPALIAELEAKLQRVHAGYAPRTALELVEWVRERVLLPEGEWRQLLDAVERDVLHDGDAAALASVHDGAIRRLVSLRLPGALGRAVCSVETLPRLARALGLDAGELELGSVRLEGSTAHPEALHAAAQLTAGIEAGEELAEAGDPLETLLAEWARFHGPFPSSRLEEVFGLDAARGGAVLDAQVDTQRWTVDRLRQGSDAIEICDTENLETLLRWARAAARPRLEPLPLERLPLFLALHQGLVGAGQSLEDLKDRLEPLLAYPAPAGLWESEILPARLDPYYTAWLDSLMQETDLVWVGVGTERLTFAFPEELPLLRLGEPEPETAEAGSSDLFPDPRGRYELADLARRTGKATAEVSARLWELAWRGRASNDGFGAVRRGVLGKFKAVDAAPPVAAVGQSGGRRRFDRWQASRPFSGAWFLLEPVVGPGDALEEGEQSRARARLLLDRYGVVFREIVARELPAFQWGAIFRALRLMELSGEVTSGYLFAGIPGPQFASPAAVRRLTAGLPADDCFWLAAQDPASPCGIDLPGLKASLPRRQAGNHVAFLGSRPVVVSQRSGRELEIRLAPDHPRLPEALRFLKVMLTRPFQPLPSIEVETINGEPAAKSPYVPILRDLFGTTVDPRAVRLWRRYG